MQRFSLFAFILVMCATTSSALGGAQVYFDLAVWRSQLESSTTIDFTGWPGEPFGPIITDQYSHLGVLFTDGNDYIVNASTPPPGGTFPNDGSGLDSGINNQINMTFDTLQYGIGADFIGNITLELYRNSTLVFSSGGFGSGPMFAGLIFDEGFDRVKIATPSFQGHLTIDDLHFGVPGPGALGVFALAGVCLGGSRRRAG